MTANLDLVRHKIFDRLFALAAVGVIAGAFAAFTHISPAHAQEFPLTIVHKHGTTIIPEKPQRVATVDGNGADNILALGLQPVTVENWYGGFENGLWPWASPLLTTEPVMLERGVLDFEQIAASDPDVILSLYNSMSQEEYEKLSLIAPVVSVPEGRGDWSLTWDERAYFTGLATGNEAEAQAGIDDLKAKVQAIADRNPDWAGRTALVAWISRDGELGGYSSFDARQQLLEQFGFVTPDSINALDPDGNAAVYLSDESIDLLDVDLLVWIRGDGDMTPILEHPSYDYIVPHQKGQEVFLGLEVTGALSYGSLLSMPVALDRIEAAIIAALDGDPTTHADDRPDNI